MRRALPCSILLACAANAVAGEGPSPSGRVLAFLAAPPADQAVDPVVPLARAPFRAETGDELVYIVRSTERGGGARGVEIVYGDGRRAPAPPIAAHGAWEEVRVPLRAGALVTGFELVARGERGVQVSFQLDDVRVERLDGTAIDVFRDALEGGARRAPGDATSAGAVPVSALAAFAADHVAIRADVSDPWSAADLSGLMALEREAEPVASDDLPRGLAWTGPCVPLRFAREATRVSIPARGQRIGLDPLDGGRFYEVWLAIVNHGHLEVEARAALVGLDGRRTPVQLRVPARGPAGYVPRPGDGYPARGYALLALDVASTTSLSALELPDDPRIAVLAVTTVWRRDGAADPRFRARWLARAAREQDGLAADDRADLERYLANRSAGGSFGAEAEESEVDRAIFDALLARDLGGLRARLTERLAAQAEAARGRKSARIELIASLPRADDDLAAALAAGVGHEHLSVAGGDARAIARLAAIDATAFERLRARVTGGTWLPFGTSFDRRSASRLGADALARRIAADQLELTRLTGAASPLGRIDGDLARLQHLPQVLASAGIQVVLLDAAPKGLANPVARLEAQGAAILAFAPQRRVEGPLRFEPTFWRSWVAAATGPLGRAPIPVLCDVSASAARETFALASTLSASDVAPEIAWVPLLDAAESRRDRGPRLEAGPLESLDRAGSRAELEALAALRALEREIARASVVDALAVLDGAPGAGAAVARAWAEIFDAAALDAPRAVSTARASEARLRASALEHLARMRPAAAPQGAGVPLVVLDTLPWPRRTLLEFAGADLRVAGAEGDLALQRTAAGGILVELQSPGTAPLALRVRRDELTEPRAPARVRLEGWTIRTDELLVEIDPKSGRIARIVALAAGRETALLRDGGDELAWVAPGAAPEPLGVLERIEYQERGPLRAVVRVVRSSPRARVETWIRVTAGAAGLEVRSRAELVDRGGDVVHAFPLARATANALVSIPLGAAPVPPSAEGLRALDGWAAASDGGATFALLGDGSSAFRWHDRAFGVVLAEAGSDAARASSFRVLGRGTGWRAAGLDAALLEVSSEPVRVACDESGRGATSREPLVRIVRVERDGRRTLGPASGIVPLSIEAGPTGSIEVRLVEARGEACQVEIAFAREPFGVERVDVLGIPLTPLTVAGRTAVVSVGAGRLEIVRARLSP